LQEQIVSDIFCMKFSRDSEYLESAKRVLFYVLKSKFKG
jgi:hypothetical protein